jgi:hypothetical protein
MLELKYSSPKEEPITIPSIQISSDTDVSENQNSGKEEEDLPPEEFLYRPKSPSKSVKTKGLPSPELLQEIMGNSIYREDSPVSTLPSRPVSNYTLASLAEDFQELSVEFPIEVLVPKQHDNIIPEYDAAVQRIISDLQYDHEVPPHVIEKVSLCSFFVNLFRYESELQLILG